MNNSPAEKIAQNCSKEKHTFGWACNPCIDTALAAVTQERDEALRRNEEVENHVLHDDSCEHCRHWKWVLTETIKEHQEVIQRMTDFQEVQIARLTLTEAVVVALEAQLSKHPLKDFWPSVELSEALDTYHAQASKKNTHHV